MKKTAVFITLAILLVCFCSCGAGSKKPLEEVAGYFDPPVRLNATVKNQTMTAKMTIDIFEPDSDVVMRTIFSEPNMLKGLVVERKQDGSLVAGYNGIETELDNNALKFIAITHDIMREVSENLAEYGEITDSGDERYGKAVILVNEGEISVFYDAETMKPLRIDSDLFETELQIDITDITSLTDSDTSNQNISSATSMTESTEESDVSEDMASGTESED